MPQGIVQQDKEVRLKRASKQTIHPPNNDINMPLLAEYKRNRHLRCAFFRLPSSLVRVSSCLGVHAVHRVQLVHLVRPWRASVLCHASVVPWPAGEELSQCLVLCLELRHVRGRSHVSRAGRCFHRLLGICSWCEIGEVGLHSTQALDVLFRGHRVVHVELAELELVLRVHCATAALRLQGVDFLQQLDVDL
jgi:hypothetical protein